MDEISETIARMDRLLNRYTVDSSGCWLWGGSKGTGGYGVICVGSWYSGKARQVVGAHRLMWERHNGPAPDRMHVMHTCDNRLCVNPEHLRLGTAKDNVRDMMSKGRENFKTLRNYGKPSPTQNAPGTVPPMLTGWQREDWIRRFGDPGMKDKDAA